jgi:hypothetical protein
MLLDLLANRNQAVQFCLHVTERFFLPDCGHWSEFIKDVPRNLRWQGRKAMKAVELWRQAPTRKAYREVHRCARRLERLATDFEALTLPMACCACVIDDWPTWPPRVSDQAVALIDAQEGPGSCVELEVEYQLMDLQLITGCRAHDLVQSKETLEWLAEDYEREEQEDLRARAAAMGLSVVLEGRYEPANCNYRTAHEKQLFLAKADGEPVGYTDAGWEGLITLLDSIARETGKRK